MFKYQPIRVIIPVYNDSKNLDATVSSIYTTNYDNSYIYTLFVDFGSTDSSVSMIKSYAYKNIGYYSLLGRRIGRTMAAEAAKQFDLQLLGDREFLLWPGDVVYDNCFSLAEKWLQSRNPNNADHFVAEVDIMTADGQKVKQQPLFTRPCYFDARSSDSLEYVKKGFRHMVLSYGKPLFRSKGKVSSQRNQRLWWNDLANVGMHSNTLYSNKVLGCYRSRMYHDEVDQLVFKFDSCLSCNRGRQESREQSALLDNFNTNYRNQLAHYALWRAWILFNIGQDSACKKCFLFSVVIFSDISKTNAYKMTEQAILQRQQKAANWLNAYYSTDEHPSAPKNPITFLNFVSNYFLKNFLTRA